MALIKMVTGYQTILMNKEINKFGKWIHIGYSWKGFGLGFRIDRYSLNIDFLWFWFGIEF